MPVSSSNSMEDFVKNSKITGTPAEIVDVYASLLKRLICTHSSSQKKAGFRIEPIMNADLPSLIHHNK